MYVFELIATRTFFIFYIEIKLLNINVYVITLLNLFEYIFYLQCRRFILLLVKF